MRKIKPIRRLYFQFNHLIPDVSYDAYEIFEALEASGLITAVGYGPDGRVSHYREAFRERLKPKEFADLIRDTVVAHYSPQGAEIRSDRDLLEEEQQGRDAELINAINRRDI